jgi:hypothetical protein
MIAQCVPAARMAAAVHDKNVWEAATYSLWRSKFGWIHVTHAKRSGTRDGNRPLKKLFRY